MGKLRGAFREVSKVVFAAVLAVSSSSLFLPAAQAEERGVDSDICNYHLSGGTSELLKTYLGDDSVIVMVGHSFQEAKGASGTLQAVVYYPKNATIRTVDSDAPGDGFAKFKERLADSKEVCFSPPVSRLRFYSADSPVAPDFLKHIKPNGNVNLLDAFKSGVKPFITGNYGLDGTGKDVVIVGSIDTGASIFAIGSDRVPKTVGEWRDVRTTRDFTALLRKADAIASARDLALGR